MGITPTLDPTLLPHTIGHVSMAPEQYRQALTKFRDDCRNWPWASKQKHEHHVALEASKLIKSVASINQPACVEIGREIIYT